jgi:hypothetical protein
MPGPLQRAFALFRQPRGPRALDGFVDSLVQSFENCRSGLSEEAIRRGGAEAYFRARYEAERARLPDVVRLENPHLDEAARAALVERVDRLVSEVVIPGYVRVAVQFTDRERRDFYHVPSAFRVLERVGFALAGVLVGWLVIKAPFIPLWSKEWILPFFLSGLVYPELRRVFQVRRYGTDLERIVADADAEIGRIDVSYLLHPGARAPGSDAKGSEAWSRSQGVKGQPTR